MTDEKTPWLLTGRSLPTGTVLNYCGGTSRLVILYESRRGMMILCPYKRVPEPDGPKVFLEVPEMRFLSWEEFCSTSNWRYRVLNSRYWCAATSDRHPEQEYFEVWIAGLDPQPVITLPGRSLEEVLPLLQIIAEERPSFASKFGYLDIAKREWGGRELVGMSCGRPGSTS